MYIECTFEGALVFRENLALSNQYVDFFQNYDTTTFCQVPSHRFIPHTLPSVKLAASKVTTENRPGVDDFHFTNGNFRYSYAWLPKGPSKFVSIVDWPWFMGATIYGQPCFLQVDACWWAWQMALMMRNFIRFWVDDFWCRQAMDSLHCQFITCCLKCVVFTRCKRVTILE